MGVLYCSDKELGLSITSTFDLLYYLFFNLLGFLTSDVDECLFTEKYDSIVVCINTEGSFEMSCPKGFYLQEESGRSTCKGLWYLDYFIM